MGENKYKGNDYRSTTVCIDSYENGVPVGRFYNLYCPEGISFLSFSQFLLQMENMFDAMNFPQPFMARRSFGDLPASAEEKAASDNTRLGKLSTFNIKVLFRQNASWQGFVSWIEGEREESFRSALELILMMDGAIKSVM